VQATCLPQGRITRCALTSYKVSLLEAIMTIQTQLREAGEEASVYVADNGGYSQTTMRQLNQAGVKWVSRVSETLTEAKTLLQEGSQTWQHSEDGTVHWFSRHLELPQGRERWVVIYTLASLQRAQQAVQRQVDKRRRSGNRRAGIWGTGASLVRLTPALRQSGN
jgi:transposase